VGGDTLWLFKGAVFDFALQLAVLFYAQPFAAGLYGRADLHFITSSVCYRRRPLLGTACGSRFTNL